MGLRASHGQSRVTVMRRVRATSREVTSVRCVSRWPRL